MSSLFVAFFTLLASTFRTRAALQAEILALHHQLAVFQKNAVRVSELRVPRVSFRRSALTSLFCSLRFESWFPVFLSQ